MIIFVYPSTVDLKIAALLGRFFSRRVYVYGNKNPITSAFYDNVDLNQIDSSGILKLFNYPEDFRLRSYVNDFGNSKIIRKSTKSYRGIYHLKEKLDLLSASTLDYEGAGTIFAFASRAKSPNERIIILNCKLKDFLFQDYKIYDESVFQFPLLINELISALVGAFSKLKRLIKDQKSREGSACASYNDKNKYGETVKKHVGLFYHKSTVYGMHYNKNHYFSTDVNSDLHESKVVKYILYPDNVGQDDLIDFSPVLKPVQFFKAFFYLFSLNLCTSSLRARKLSIRLTYYYLQYLSWKQMLNNYMLTAAIIDYDVLFPKPLSMALESQGVKTCAFQERPAFAMQNLQYGVVTDVYFFAGNIWKRYATDRCSIIAQSEKSFAPWRVKFFDECAYKLIGSTYHKPLAIDVLNSKKIVFLGYFLSEDSYGTCKIAIDKFLEYVVGVACLFTSSMVLIRMKDLDTKTLDYLVKKVGAYSNVYISTDYDSLGLSYALCRDADVIVSVQTSIAEESLYYGKKVVFLDDIGSVIKMCRDIYPPEFSFLCVSSTDELVKKINDIFRKKHSLMIKYKELMMELMGDENPYAENAIPLAIEEGLLRTR